MGLSPEAQKKSVFITPMGKSEFKKVPLNLAQALAHFQQLIYIVLQGRDLTFGYLDDILMYNQMVMTLLEHVW